MKSTNTEKAKAAEILLNCGTVIFRPKQPFKFASGVLSPIYVDNRILISYPAQRKKIIKLFLQAIKKFGKFDVLAGTSTAGIPQAAWLAEALKLPMVYVRSAPKEHGKENQVEGHLARGQKVLVVEDTISTGRSSIEVIDGLKKAGAKVIGEVAIYTHGLKAADEAFKKANVKLEVLTDLNQMTQVAKGKGILDDQKVAMILDWAKDPENWGNKMGFE